MQILIILIYIFLIRNSNRFSPRHFPHFVINLNNKNIKKLRGENIKIWKNYLNLWQQPLKILTGKI